MKLEKITGRKTDFLQRFVIGNNDTFSPLGSHLEDLRVTRFFNVITWISEETIATCVTHVVSTDSSPSRCERLK